MTSFRMPVLAYGCASLLHFAHNAVFFGAYPNMPAWLSAAKVWMAWLGIAAIGVLGVWSAGRWRGVQGLFFLALFAAFGFAGLDHYHVAAISEHTLAMNLTIWIEVLTASWLLIAIAVESIRRQKNR